MTQQVMDVLLVMFVVVGLTVQFSWHERADVSARTALAFGEQLKASEQTAHMIAHSVYDFSLASRTKHGVPYWTLAVSSKKNKDPTRGNWSGNASATFTVAKASSDSDYGLLLRSPACGETMSYCWETFKMYAFYVRSDKGECVLALHCDDAIYSAVEATYNQLPPPPPPKRRHSTVPLFGPGWAATGKPRAVFQILVPAGKALAARAKAKTVKSWGGQAAQEEHLERCLKLIDLHFNDKYHYPVVLLHEPDLSTDYKARIRGWSRSSLVFYEFSFQRPKVPGVLETNDLKYPETCTCRKDLCDLVGYKHMCRYNSALFATMSLFDQVDYMWRLDDDSILSAPVKYDVFAHMAEKNYWYGWNSMDIGSCVTGLWQATRDYVNTSGIKPEWFSSLQEKHMYYNNFEVSRVALWRSREYQSYFSHIDRTMGIYKYRWGDAPIKTIGVSLFVPKARIKKFTDVSYTHQHARAGPLTATTLKSPNPTYWRTEWGKESPKRGPTLKLKDDALYL